MAKFLPVFLASIQYAYGIYIFRKPVIDTMGPFLASLIVLFSLFLMLLDIGLFPQAFQKLERGQLIIEYFLATFLTELIMGDCWFPLDAFIQKAIPAFSVYLEDILFSYNTSCDYICPMLKNTLFGVMTSYLLSFIILIGVLQTTQAINLSLLEGGFSVFVEDLKKRMRRKTRKISRKIENAHNKISGCIKTHIKREPLDFYFVDENSEGFLKITDHFYRGD